MGMKGRRIALAALLALAGGAGVWAIAARTSSTTSRSGALTSSGTPEARLAMLDNSLQAIDAGLRDAPRDRWDPAYVVEVLGKDPDTLFAWVRENTAWIPYRGVLRGAAGVLMDREGSSIDRALLLATMLEKAGHTVRLAHGELSREQAATLLPALVARRAALMTESLAGLEGDLQPAAAQHQLPTNAFARTQESMTTGLGRLFEELHARTADQTERLLREVQRPDPDAEWIARYEHAITTLQDHWWVQLEVGTTWRDLDVMTRETVTAHALTAAASTFGIADLPADVHHQLAVRVVAEQWNAGTLSERRVLEHVLRPFESLGEPMILQIWPSAMPRELHGDPDSPLGLRAAALEQDAWTAALGIGTKVVGQGALSLGAAPAAGGGAFGGLGAAMAGAAKQANGTSAPAAEELSAVWIEYEIRAPGDSALTIRRAVFDLFGPAARAAHATTTLHMDEQKRLVRSLALMLRTEMLPVTSALAPEYLAHLTGRNLLANSAALRTIAAGASDPSAIDTDSLLEEGGPPLTPLYSLALARLEWSRFGDVQLVDRIGLLTRHRHPGPMGDAITLRGAVDVVTGDFGVSLTVRDAFVVRHAQGVFDTNAEALWWTGEGLNNTGEAFATSRDWLTLDSPDANLDRLRLPADARARIAQDLASGLIVVAPGRPVPRGPDEFVGWWRIDPATGLTEGVAGNGWGQCGTEYAATVEGVVARALWRSLWEYVLCQGINQAINDFRRTGAELQARGIWFTWVGPIQSASPEDVFWSSNKGCLIGAIQAGFVSTLPFLIARYNVATQPWLMPRAAWLDRLLGNPDRRIPPLVTRPRFPGMIRAGVRGGPIVPAAVAQGGGSGTINPLAKTQPDLGTTQPGVPPTPPRVGPPTPGPRTGPPAPGPRTGPPAPGPGTGPPAPGPRTPATLPEPATPAPGPHTRLDAARAAHEAAGAAETEALHQELSYRASRPGGSMPTNPTWNEAEYKRLVAASDQAAKATDATRAELRAATKAVQPTVGRGSGLANPPPGPVPCLQGCGNENPTVPNADANSPSPAPSPSPPGALSAGITGVATSFDPGDVK